VTKKLDEKATILNAIELDLSIEELEKKNAPTGVIVDGPFWRSPALRSMTMESAP